jgi:hypothetical protein
MRLRRAAIGQAVLSSAMGSGGSVRIMKVLWIGLFFFAVLGIHPSPLKAADEAEVEKSFVEFQKDWIKKLNTEGKYGEKSMRVEKASGDGTGFVATYEVVKEPKASQVKKTDQKATPYIGTVQYEIWTCSARGNSQEEARRGPFGCEPRSETKEIFRFTGSKWVY